MKRPALLTALCVCLMLAGQAGCKKGTCDEKLLPGLWTSATYTVQIFNDFTFEAAGAPNLSQIHVTGEIETDGCDFIITDLAGDYACPEDQIGSYTFTVTASRLTLSAVDDPCAGRKNPLDGATLQRAD